MVLTMKINGEVLRTISVFPNMMTVPDCVVVSSNKLGHGHGEAKFYISSKEDMYSFYGGEKFTARCFMLKTDLIAYMNAIQKYIELIRKIIYEEGYEINEGKFRLQYAHQRQEVTGLIVNKEVAIPKKRINELENAIYYCKKYGVVDHMSHIGCEKGFYKEHLYGLAYYIKMVNPEKGLKYLLQLNEIEWPI